MIEIRGPVGSASLHASHDNPTLDGRTFIAVGGKAISDTLFQTGRKTRQVGLDLPRCRANAQLGTSPEGLMCHRRAGNGSAW
jgi:hypothetical protein